MKSPDSNTPEKDQKSVMAQAASALTIIPDQYFIQETDPAPYTLGDPDTDKPQDQDSGQQDDQSNPTSIY